MSPIDSHSRDAKTTKVTVQFKSKVRIRKVSSHRDWSREEKSKCWYTSQDFSIMKAETIFIIKTAIADWEEMRAIGLEAPHYCRVRRANIQKAKVAVLVEQEKLWRVGAGSHMDMLSMRSQLASLESREDARSRAEIVSAHVHGMKMEGERDDNLLNDRMKYIEDLVAKKRSSDYVKLPERKSATLGRIHQDLSITLPSVQERHILPSL